MTSQAISFFHAFILPLFHSSRITKATMPTAAITKGNLDSILSSSRGLCFARVKLKLNLELCRVRDVILGYQVGAEREKILFADRIKQVCLQKPQSLVSSFNCCHFIATSGAVGSKGPEKQVSVNVQSQKGFLEFFRARSRIIG